MTSPRVAAAMRQLRRAVSWHRRLLAGGLAAGAMACTIAALQPAGPAATRVLVATHDLRGGQAIAPGDFRAARLPTGAVPAGAVTDIHQVLGRVLAAPMRRGEPLTDVGFVGPSLLQRYGPNLVGAPVRIADPATVRLLEPGDTVDVLAARHRGGPAARARTDTGTARTVAARVTVITVLRSESTMPARDDRGALVLLATTPEQSARLAQAVAGSRLSVTLRSG